MYFRDPRFRWSSGVLDGIFRIVFNQNSFRGWPVGVSIRGCCSAQRCSHVAMGDTDEVACAHDVGLTRDTLAKSVAAGRHLAC